MPLVRCICSAELDTSSSTPPIFQQQPCPCRACQQARCIQRQCALGVCTGSPQDIPHGSVCDCNLPNDQGQNEFGPSCGIISGAPAGLQACRACLQNVQPAPIEPWKISSVEANNNIDSIDHGTGGSNAAYMSSTLGFGGRSEASERSGSISRIAAGNPGPEAYLKTNDQVVTQVKDGYRARHNTTTSWFSQNTCLSPDHALVMPNGVRLCSNSVQCMDCGVQMGCNEICAQRKTKLVYSIAWNICYLLYLFFRTCFSFWIAAGYFIFDFCIHIRQKERRVQMAAAIICTLLLGAIIVTHLTHPGAPGRQRASSPSIIQRIFRRSTPREPPQQFYDCEGRHIFKIARRNAIPTEMKHPPALLVWLNDRLSSN